MTKYKYKHGKRTDGPDSPREAEFRQFVKQCIGNGISPTPLKCLQAGFGTGRYLGGNLSSIRIEEFEKAGWKQPGGVGTRWVPPLG